jgi:hypothetical protein
MRNSCYLSAQDDNLGADLRAIVEVSDIGGGHADTSGGDGKPMASGSFEPWMRYIDEPRYRAQAPRKLPRPPFIERGKSGRRRSIAVGGRQSGHSRFMLTVLVPDQVKTGRPTPTPYRIA